MSEMTSSPADLPVLATVACPYCGVVVPTPGSAAPAVRTSSHSGLRASQRLHSYAAFPDEPVFRLSVVTSLFPHLSHRAKAPFRIAFAVFVLLLLIFALAGASAPLIAVSALSVPRLFLLYIWEVDPYEGSFLPPTVLCLLLGAGLGAGWAIVGGSYVDKALLPSLNSEPHQPLGHRGGARGAGRRQLLVCVPMVVVRALQRGRIESLDGFVAGATGALGFTLAATIDLMSPWLSNGQLTHESFLANITQVILRGVTVPLVTALATGFIGTAFWAKSGGRATSARGVWLTSPGLALALALVVQVGLGFTDIAALSDAVLIGVHVAALGVLTLAMRVGLHYVLLHEALDVTTGAPRVCANCSHLVPAMASARSAGSPTGPWRARTAVGATWPLINGVTTPPPSDGPRGAVVGHPMAHGATGVSRSEDRLSRRARAGLTDASRQPSCQGTSAGREPRPAHGDADRGGSPRHSRARPRVQSAHLSRTADRPYGPAAGRTRFRRDLRHPLPELQRVHPALPVAAAGPDRFGGHRPHL